MALVTMTVGLCYWVKSPSPESSTVGDSLSRSQQGGYGHGVTGGLPGDFCTILLGHYQLDKLCALWSGQDNLDKVSADCNSTGCFQ